MHVLGTPPAFILSQDQTLMFVVCLPYSVSFWLPVLFLVYCFWLSSCRLSSLDFKSSCSSSLKFRLPPLPSSSSLPLLSLFAPLRFIARRAALILVRFRGSAFCFGCLQARSPLPFSWNFQGRITVYLSRFTFDIQGILSSSSVRCRHRQL